jgi:hypothetical protein
MCPLIVTSIKSCWVSVTHRWVFSSSFGNVMRHAIEIITLIYNPLKFQYFFNNVD